MLSVCVRNLCDNNRNESYQVPGNNIWYLSYGIKTRNLLLLLLYLWYENSWWQWQWRGGRCTRMICTRSKGTVPGKRPDHIIINQAAKPTKLPNNTYWCKSHTPPSTCVYRYRASCHPRRHERRRTLSVNCQCCPAFCYELQAHSVTKKAAVRTDYVRTTVVVTYVNISGKDQATRHHHTTCTRDWSLFLLASRPYY